MIDYAFDFIRLNQYSLETIGCHSTSREVEHITTTEEILGTYLVKNCARIDIGCYGEGNTRWDVGFDESCDDID